MQPVALITGASSGLGAELARVFAAHGHALVLTARRVADLTALADGIAMRGQPRPHVIPLDLAQAGAPAQLATELATRGLEPAYVVNNAGFGVFGPAAEAKPHALLSLADLNIRALTDLSLRFADSLARHHGGLLNVASIAAFLPGPRLAAYHASKAYVVSFTEALHQEWKANGVRVCVLCPGPIQTEFTQRAGVPQGHFPKSFYRSAGRIAREGYEGLMRGERRVVPGFHNKVATMLWRVLPRDVLLALADRAP